jgi:twitching motility protein PilT
VETSGYSGGFVPGPSPVPAAEETTLVSPLDPAWQPPQAAAPQVAAEQVPVPGTPLAYEPAAAPAYPPPVGAPVAYQPAEPMALQAYPPPVAPAPVPMAAAPMAAAPMAAPALGPMAPPVLPQPAPPAAVAPAPTVPVDLAPTAWQDQAAAAGPAGVGIAESEAFDGAYHRSSTEETSLVDDVDLHAMLGMVIERGASDLHLTSGSRPQLRINGNLSSLEEFPELTPPVIQRVMYAAITQRQREQFEEVLELDFAYSVPGKARFRVNMYRQRDSVGAAFRLIPFEIKKLEDLGLPPGIANFAMLPRGFVVVTGPTGSGKSTTLASIVDLSNRNRRDHIMTVEDPIEFLHTHQSCIVNQREVGEDTHSFANALKHVLRQDPDIIMVGEMRDLETISVALTAAETGHLVFATLHTQDAAQTIDRIIDVFPPHQQQQVRVQLAGSLQGVVCQALARTVDGQGRVVATEILVATPAVRNLIREGKTHQIYSAMQAGSQHGMHTMDQHLADLVKRGRITFETGLEKCHHIEDFNRLTGRG